MSGVSRSKEYPSVMVSTTSPLGLVVALDRIADYFKCFGKDPSFHSKVPAVKNVVDLLNSHYFHLTSEVLDGFVANVMDISGTTPIDLPDDMLFVGVNANDLKATYLFTNLIGAMIKKESYSVRDACMHIGFTEEFPNLKGGVLSFFDVPRDTHKDIEFTNQRLFNILAGLFFVSKKPSDHHHDTVFLRSDSSALAFFHESCTDKEKFFSEKALFRAGGHLYIGVPYMDFFETVIAPWFLAFISRATLNNGDVI